MEMPETTPCVAILNKQKYNFFSFTKSENRRAKHSLSGEGVGTSSRGVDVRKDCGRVNMVQILCTNRCKWKNDTCETILGRGEEWIKDNDGGGKLNYDIFDTLEELL
jgi:hypothetical protein